MKRVLQINSSIFGPAGHSTQLANQFIQMWKAADPSLEVAVRDLGACPVPHLDAERFGALVTPPEHRSVEQQAVVDMSDGLINELREADVVVLATPIYNHSIPSGLKAYFDHVARAGETFRYTKTGSIGLLEGRKLIVISALGGPFDPVGLSGTGYVSVFFEFLGFSVSAVLYAENLNVSEEAKAEGLAQAGEAIKALVTRLASGDGDVPRRFAAANDAIL